MYEAKVIADSICNGQRLTTMQLTHPRIVHAEFNTHCMFSRNASSSRAIPFAVTVKKVENDPMIPVWWGKNQSGMQAAEELTMDEQAKAISLWLQGRNQMADLAREMASPVCLHCVNDAGVANPVCPWCHGSGKGLNIHKQIVNRLLEPWSWITVCVTGDWGAWSNYFALRCHKDAQPEIQRQAYMAQLAYFLSKPKDRLPGEWHTPYVSSADREKIMQGDFALTFRHQGFAPMDYVVWVSVGRCARTSYLTQEGKRDFAEDVKLHDRLRFHDPLHASPFEHVCQAKGDGKQYHKYKGWKAYRHFLPREYVTDFVPNHDLLEQVDGEWKLKAGLDPKELRDQGIQWEVE